MSCEDEYTLGGLLRMPATFKVGTVLTDPTTITFKYLKPSAVLVTLIYGTDAALVKDSTGKYHVDLDLDEAGLWKWRYWSTGAVQAAAQGDFRVAAANV